MNQFRGNIGDNNQGIQIIGDHSGNGSLIAPSLTFAEKAEALRIANTQYGNREINIIKNLDVGSLIEGPVAVLKNIAEILRKVRR